MCSVDAGIDTAIGTPPDVEYAFGYTPQPGSALIVGCAYYEP